MHVPLPRPLDSSGFSVGTALDAGVLMGRLRSSDLRTPHHGVRAHGPVPEDEEREALIRRCREYAPLLRDGQAFSHMTAAILWNLPVPPKQMSHNAPLHVVATGAKREPRRRGVRGHVATDIPLTEIEGLPVVHPLRAWMQCAEFLGLDDVVALGDALLSRWSGIAESSFLSRDELERAVRAASGRRGAAALGTALTLCRDNVWSPQETRLRLVIVRSGRREPDELNRDQFGADGSWLGVPDMAYPAEKIAIEYEGKEFHDEDSGRFDSDIEKGERFAAADWRVLRVSKAQLASPGPLTARIVRFLPARDDKICSRSR